MKRILRKVDDMGRVVIPKEFRDLLELKAGESLDVFIDTESGRVVFQKRYDEYMEDAEEFVESDEAQESREKAINNFNSFDFSLRNEDLPRFELVTPELIIPELKEPQLESPRFSIGEKVMIFKEFNEQPFDATFYYIKDILITTSVKGAESIIKYDINGEHLQEDELIGVNEVLNNACNCYGCKEIRKQLRSDLI